MKLTKTIVEALPSAAKDRFVWDERLPGFGLKVTPAGRRSYVVQYRPRGRGQTRRVTLGVHGKPWTVDQARSAAEQILLRVRKGEDPVESDRRARAEAESALAMTAANERQKKQLEFQSVLTTFIERHARPRNRRWKDAQRVIDFDATPVWRGRCISSISKGEVIALVDSVQIRSPSSARALFAQLRRMFSWCVERDLLERSPCDGMKAPAAVKSRDRFLTDYEIKLLCSALDDVGGPFAPLFQLLLFTGQRREEVTGMHWSEVDLERAEWIIPKERCKNGSGHAVDLAPAVVKILSSLERRHSLVFTTNGMTPLSNHAKYRQRLLQRMQELDGEHKAVPEWRVHDLRRTAATGMAAGGTLPHVIEAVLNHRSGVRGSIVAVYQHYHYRPQRKAALLHWADHVSSIASSSLKVSKPSLNIDG